MRALSIVAVCLWLLSCSDSSSEAEKEGARSAERWLAIVDSGAYEESWVESAGLFQSSIAQAEWVKILGKVRQPIGANLERSLDKTEYTLTLPGTPDGEFVIATFSASFEKKAKAIETVTVSKSDGEKWKVVGYFIK